MILDNQNNLTEHLPQDSLCYPIHSALQNSVPHKVHFLFILE